MAMMLIGFVVTMLALWAGFRLGGAAVLAQQTRAAGEPPPEGWSARCTCCGIPIGYQITWAPEVAAMRKDVRDRIKFDLQLVFPKVVRAGKPVVPVTNPEAS